MAKEQLVLQLVRVWLVVRPGVMLVITRGPVQQEPKELRLGVQGLVMLVVKVVRAVIMRLVEAVVLEV